MPVAAYDEIADWYAEWVGGPENDYSKRVKLQLQQLLGRPTDGDVCVDIACGTGVRAEILRGLGWRAVGVDLSAGQLRHAAKVMPVVVGDATALPMVEAGADAVICVLAHSDMPDYAAAVREAARILKPGGTFVHVGIHPAFSGAFADRSDASRVIVDGSYHRRERRFDSWTAEGVRSRIGAWHIPVAELVQLVIDVGLTLTKVAESSGDGAVPDIMSIAARK